MVCKFYEWIQSEGLVGIQRQTNLPREGVVCRPDHLWSVYAGLFCKAERCTLRQANLPWEGVACRPDQLGQFMPVISARQIIAHLGWPTFQGKGWLAGRTSVVSLCRPCSARQNGAELDRPTFLGKVWSLAGPFWGSLNDGHLKAFPGDRVWHMCLNLVPGFLLKKGLRVCC